MAKQKGEGPYHNNPHKDGPPGGNKMDAERTRPKTVADGVSFADVVDRNSSNAESNYGLTSSIKRKK